MVAPENRGAWRFVAPLFALTVLAIGNRWLASRPVPDAGRAPSASEQRASRAAFDRDSANAGRRAAQAFAEARLFGAHNITVRDWSVTPQKRGRYRVRGTATGVDARGALVSRPFEADLLYGPADAKWRLVDTEFVTILEREPAQTP